MAVGEQAVVADAVEALGQHVQEEPADELVGGERHRLPAFGSVDAIVLPAEGDAVVVGRDETAIGDGDAVGVAREIAQHLLGSGERVLGVDHPFDLAQRGRKRLKARLSASAAWSPKNLKRPCVWALTSIARNRPRNRRDNTLTCTRKRGRLGDPSRAILRQPSARHDHVHVRMMGHSRTPGMEHRDDADAGAQVLVCVYVFDFTSQTGEI